jgi:hypothetical protein
MGVIAAFLMGAALAVLVHPRPLFHDILAYINGDNAFDRCIKAGACNAVRAGSPDAPAPAPRRQPAPDDMDRA